ncbi:hypothetical protein AWB68_04279 [Caballeronia choica]|uniref:Uncharacterized protein n=1 Tax=Caballeronia choica TaxID=326476 RepID=A0A158JUX1_9BURK|nr:hypothetical protein [Caballeronia choica]SAL72515.1 hypothetical protein AWB68_04279 [Caballeronia choica]
MNETPMTPERFRHLADAYGASIERWPEAERAAARALIARGDGGALAALAEAGALDVFLAAHAVEAPEPALIRRIVDRANPRPVWKSPRVWFSGAGFIGVGAAGVAAGALAISMLGAASAPTFSDPLWPGTAFSGAPADWSEQ